MIGILREISASPTWKLRRCIIYIYAATLEIFILKTYKFPYGVWLTWLYFCIEKLSAIIYFRIAFQLIYLVSNCYEISTVNLLYQCPKNFLVSVFCPVESKYNVHFWTSLPNCPCETAMSFTFGAVCEEWSASLVECCGMRCVFGGDRARGEKPGREVVL